MHGNQLLDEAKFRTLKDAIPDFKLMTFSKVVSQSITLPLNKRGSLFRHVDIFAMAICDFTAGLFFSLACHLCAKL